MPETVKPWLSPTQLEMIAKCPAAYERRYCRGEKIPPGIEAIKGTGVHGGASTNFRQKLQTHEDLPINQIVDAAVASFEGATHAGFTLTPEEHSVGPSKVIGAAKDQVVSLATLLGREVVRDYQPVLVEQQVRLELPDASHDMLGILDLADDQRRVIDFKTSAKAKSQAEADSSIQLTFYAAAHKVATGELPTEVRLEVLVKKRQPERVIVRSTRGREDFVALANRINVVLAQVNAGIFPPASPGSWWCAAKWCGYYATCPYVNSRPQVVYDLKVPARRTLDGAPIPEPMDESPALDLTNQLVESLATVKATPRLKTYKNPRDRLFAENPHCRWCGATLTKRTATLDHVVPLGQGGANKFENYCLACRECNSKRADTGLTPEHAATAAGAH